MTWTQTALLAALAVAAPVPPPVPVDDWTGQSVVGKKPSGQIAFGDRPGRDRVEFQFQGHYPVKVREDRGGWLRIFDGRTEGWVAKDDFVPARDATAYYTDRLRADPDDGNAWVMRGLAWRDLKDYDNALKDFTEAMRFYPNSPSVLNNRGNAWSGKKDYDKAVADYTEAVRLNPGYVLPFNNRGTRGGAKGEYDKAVADYTEAVRLDPRYALAFNNRGFARFQMRDYDKAIRDYDEAVRIDPGYAGAHFNRAVARTTDRRADAVGGFRATIDLQGWRGDRAVYAVVFGNLAARRDGDGAAAAKFLADPAGTRDYAWPYPAVRFLRGEIDEPALLALATDDDKRTEARCVLGLDHALRGRKDEAAAHFRWVKEHGTKTFTEYAVAAAELDRLEAAPPGRPR